MRVRVQVRGDTSGRSKSITSYENTSASVPGTLDSVSDTGCSAHHVLSQ